MAGPPVEPPAARTMVSSDNVPISSLCRILCVAYVVALCALLLTDLPYELAHRRPALNAAMKGFSPAFHVFGFFLLGAVFVAARWPGPRWLLAGLVLAFAGATEWLQMFVPRRTPDWSDAALNLVGAAILVVCHRNRSGVKAAASRPVT